MFRLVDCVAPRNLPDLILKSLILVLTFALFDKLIGSLTIAMRERNHANDFVITFMIGAPFGLFVMAIMAYQRGLQLRLTTLATTDALTGLPNRRAFMDNAAVASLGEGENIVLLIDADHFKNVNDTYGHDVGDQCLIAIGEHLIHHLRTGDLVGRIGGEEFAVLIPRTTVEVAQKISERICTAITVDIGHGTEELSITLSIGARIMTCKEDLADALRAADQALYRAKENGRARVEWSTELAAA